MTVLSVHIPKTGGTSFLDILRDHYGQALVLDYGLPRASIDARLQAGAPVACIHGHYRAEKYADLPNPRYVTWLREPIDRLISSYNFWKTHRYPDQPVWRRFHYENWSFMDYALAAPLRNEQANYIGTVNFDEFKLVGITEFYDESISLFHNQLGLATSSDIPHHRRADAERAAAERKDLSRRDVAVLIECHAVDYDLYLRGLARFRQLLSQTRPAPAPQPTVKRAALAAAGSLLSKSDAPVNAAVVPAIPAVRWGPEPLKPAHGDAAMTGRGLNGDRMQAQGLKQIRGTYFYGDAWPVNAWDAFRRETVAPILRQIKADGYNTVVLLVPAALPVIKQKRPDFYRQFVDDFSFVVQQVEIADLHLALRLAFAWDGYPIELDRGRVCFDQLAGGEGRAGLKDVLHDVWNIVGNGKNFLFGFITWEDMLSFPIHRATRAGAAMKLKLAEAIEFRVTPDGIPAQADPNFRLFLDHLDDKFAELFYDIKTVFPPLTAEVRVDVTPYQDDAGTEQHFLHNRQMIEIDSDIIGTYFGTYMMHGPLPRTAEQAMRGMDLAHQQLRAIAPSKRPFVDQFNFVMDEKTFSHFEKMDDPEEARFLEQVVGWFDDKTAGYATWSFVDYMMDVVSNSAFKLGLEGWTLRGTPQLQIEAAGRWVSMRAGDAIRGTNIRHYSGWITDGFVLLDAEVAQGDVIRLSIADEVVMEFTANDFKPVPFGKGGRVVRPFTGQSKYVEVEVIHGTARVMKVSVGHDICSNGGHSIQFEPSRTSQRIAKLNHVMEARERGPVL